MLLRKTFTITFLLLTVFVCSFGQDRCGTVEYTKKLQQKQVLFEKDHEFERWLGEKMKVSPHAFGQRRMAAAYQIPVVVHIIHNGELVGTGTNISEAQVLSQISVLNEDYQRMNADASKTPSEFLPVAGNLDVEFVLAKRTPEGLATNGIVRVQGPKPSWTSSDNYDLKKLSYWPAEDYLNIWVCKLTDFLGYAQFPVSDLPGLENSSTNRETDGVVISVDAFGSIDDGNFNLNSKYNKGRTATHEIGHFLGLRHIWGDDSGACGGNGDYVSDTPDQADDTNTCPSHPQTSCNGIVTMFQNYLDYTDDACMNLFTKGQVNRMIAILENSPRRKTLPASPGLQEPAPVPDDLGIKEIVSPLAGECSTTIVPEITVRNYGSNDIISAQIQVKRDGVAVETKSVTLNLSNLESAQVTFSPVTFSGGSHTITFTILQTNGNTDGNPYNNVKELTFSIPQTITTPFSENFNTVPSAWTILNPDQGITWQRSTAPHTSEANQAMKINFYDYEDGFGEIDFLVTPAFDLSSAPFALLIFDVAYAEFSGKADRLKVVVLTDCNTDINSGTVVYDKSGATLSTHKTFIDFEPDGTDDWRTETVNLNAFIGQNKIQLAFVGINDYGNNLYLDNIRVLTSDYENVTLRKVVSPSPVTCEKVVTPVLQVSNSGTAISSFDVTYTVNGETRQASFSGLPLGIGAELEVELPQITLSGGENELAFEVINPNGTADLDPSDNLLQSKMLVNDVRDEIPFREGFESPSFTDRWTIINPTNGIPWTDIALEDNTAIRFACFNDIYTGYDAWLVSPVLDFSTTTDASLFFDLSYAYRKGRIDRLQVLASTDCGSTFDTVLKTYQGEELSDSTVTTEWEPNVSEDWSKKSVKLQSLVGQQNVRLAFVATNGNGNNIYLDNIEVFLSKDPLLIEESFAVYPNPAETKEENTLVNITFNLPEKSDITIDIVDPTGKAVITEHLDKVLNQTYVFLLNKPTAGLYLVRVTTAKNRYVTRLVIKR